MKEKASVKDTGNIPLNKQHKWTWKDRQNFGWICPSMRHSRQNTSKDTEAETTGSVWGTGFREGWR